MFELWINTSFFSSQTCFLRSKPIALHYSLLYCVLSLLQRRSKMLKNNGLNLSQKAEDHTYGCIESQTLNPTKEIDIEHILADYKFMKMLKDPKVYPYLFPKRNQAQVFFFDNQYFQKYKSKQQLWKNRVSQSKSQYFSIIQQQEHFLFSRSIYFLFKGDCKLQYPSKTSDKCVFSMKIQQNFDSTSEDLEVISINTGFHTPTKAPIAKVLSATISPQNKEQGMQSIFSFGIGEPNEIQYMQLNWLIGYLNQGQTELGVVHEDSKNAKLNTFQSTWRSTKCSHSFFHSSQIYYFGQKFQDILLLFMNLIVFCGFLGFFQGFMNKVLSIFQFYFQQQWFKLQNSQEYHLFHLDQIHSRFLIPQQTYKLFRQSFFYSNSLSTSIQTTIEFRFLHSSFVYQIISKNQLVWFFKF
ncbi:unnamed protein product (macronuclear) [Paramecium tetraurelia]|uniref:Transmembrane protein n=1 Tax=Paramecium tetraurelia TaxID=5888 RepID=A0DK41_PARTE|nr:uncharacterized protein GSPATT00017737001 [Paramecium tetraurelia]CAK83408.1 unnamed protein product [Paramecium tetraurelia]|eukprot:XP_001450805.1 hypothetical protein (macronuclear) [Paramecium tetraurelia strain d4-2]